MNPGRQQGFIHPSCQGRGRQPLQGPVDTRLIYPLVLVCGSSLLVAGTATDLSPWLLSAGGGLMLLAAWLVWRQRALLRQRWQAAEEEMHKLY